MALLVIALVLALTFLFFPNLRFWENAADPQKIVAAIRGDLDKLKGDLDRLKAEREKSDREAAARKAAEEKAAAEAAARRAAEEKAAAEAAARKAAEGKAAEERAAAEARKKTEKRAAQLPPFMPFSRVPAASKEEVLTRLVTGADLIISKEKLIERLKEIVGRRKRFGTGAEGEFTSEALMEILRRDGVVICVPFRASEALVDALVRADKARGEEKIASFRRDSYPNECYLGIREGDRIYRVLSLLCFNTIDDHTGVPAEKKAETPESPKAPIAKAEPEWKPYIPPPRPKKKTVVVVVAQPAPVVVQSAPRVVYAPQPQVMYAPQPVYAPPPMYAAPAYGGGGPNFALAINRTRVNQNQNVITFMQQPPPAVGGPPIVSPPVPRVIGGPPIIGGGGGMLPGVGVPRPR